MRLLTTASLRRSLITPPRLDSDPQNTTSSLTSVPRMVGSRIDISLLQEFLDLAIEAAYRCMAIACGRTDARSVGTDGVLTMVPAVGRIWMEASTAEGHGYIFDAAVGKHGDGSEVITMKKWVGFFILVGLVWSLFRFHFILLDHRIKVLAKSKLTLDQTFVDARGAKKMRLLLDPDLVKAGLNDLLKELPD